MNRAIISQRITSILAEIERLNNALYAMNTTDIQRYPDNYEVLSTDAALRAERITCRLRHLIYATTSIKKEEYLRSAETMQGIEISENDGILEIKLPCLLPKRRQRQSAGSAKARSSCWIRLPPRSPITPPTTPCRNFSIVWSVFPISMRRSCQSAVSAIMTIWN